MIKIKRSPTAVSKEQLLQNSEQHIRDVRRGVDFFQRMLNTSATLHDIDKLINIDQFYNDFATGFEETGWWEAHKKSTRHHLVSNGVPEDVNLIDVLEMIADCVMAGNARTGEIYPVTINTGVLLDAFQNTVELLKAQVVVE